MSHHSHSHARISPENSRRILLKKMLVLTGGILLTPFLGHVSYGMDKGKAFTEFEQNTLSNFIQIIIPGAVGYCKFLIDELSDDFYDFRKYLGFIINHLDSAAQARFNRNFNELPVEEKRDIVEFYSTNGLISKQVFNGAIYVIQIVVYSGICEEDQSCPIIDFPGRNKGKFNNYDNYKMLMAAPLTSDGNPW